MSVCRFKTCSRLLICLSLAFLISDFAVAQSTFDLEPPMQSETETDKILMAADPNAIPTFTFAVARIDEDGKVQIVRSIPNQQALPPAAPDESAGIPYTENVTQNYTVAVPYTENVNGKVVTRTRMETRTRTVPVTRIRPRNAEEQAEYEKRIAKEPKKPAAPKRETKTIQVPYDVQVPHAEVVDGRNTTVMKRIRRMRTVNVVRGETETKEEELKEGIPLAEIKCYSVVGKELDQAEIKNRLAENAGVILIKDPKSITPFFETILKPETIFLVKPIE